MENSTIEIIQDCTQLQSAMLIILEALETGVMPKSFCVFNDAHNDDIMRSIAIELQKRGVKVPPDNIE